jgi:hypothetical protein
MDMQIVPNWSGRREASLNWLALGLLLAAWNLADGGAEPAAPRRPAPLRGYAPVTVRGVQRAFTQSAPPHVMQRQP